MADINKDLQLAVAKTLFACDTVTAGQTMDIEEKKKKWGENKASYLRAARQFMAHAERQGLAIEKATETT